MPRDLPKIEGEPTIEEVQEYLLNAIMSFDSDPADSPFQRGYKTACETIYADLFKIRQ
jgi:hypothetical protein